MQSSSSFELARTGRKRPTDLFPLRTSFELSVSSPSFNAEHVINSTPIQESQVGADDATLSSSSKRYPMGIVSLSVSPASPHASMPPTPVTAGLPLEDAPASRTAVTLPGIGQMLAAAPLHQPILTPPYTARVPIGPRIGRDDDLPRFEGPRPQWVQDEEHVAFTDVRYLLAPTRGSPFPRGLPQLTPHKFHDIVRKEEDQGTVGLGFVSTEDAPTPRIGSFGSNALGVYIATTPTQAQISQRVLRAPALEQEEDGIFPNNTPSSPISPPLRGWNTDLNFPEVEFTAPSPRLTSVAMEREQQVILQGVMPSQRGLLGLGISLDGNEMEADNQPLILSSRSILVDIPPTPRSNASDRLEVFSTSTGLTPTFNSSRIADVSDRTGSCCPTAAKSPSPSLRTKSKKRSELVRKEAEAAVSAISHSRSSASPPHGLLHRAGTNNLSPSAQGLSREENFAPSPRKRSLSEVDTNLHANSATVFTPSQKSKCSSSRAKASTSPTANPSSPWGIFRVKEEGWKPLGPPGGGRAVGVSAVRGNAVATGSKKSLTSLSAASVNNKQRRTGPNISSASVINPTSRKRANKENIPPSSAHSSFRGGSDQTSLGLGGKYRRSANTANADARDGGSADVFGSGGPLAPKSPSISSAARRTSDSRPISVPTSGAAPRRRL